MSNNELTIKNQGYMGIADFNISDRFSEELAGLDSSFDRIKIPAGGGTMFELPGENADETNAVKEFSAVILYHHPMYTFYSSKYNGSNNPPDCVSIDGVTGVGMPGGMCINCTNNKFGSGENGSKACKNKHQMYLLRENEIFPVILSLPTSSNKEFSRYIKRLLSTGKKSSDVVTKFSLKKAVNKTGISYSQVQFVMERALTPDENELVNKMAEQIKLYAKGNETTSASANVDKNTGEVMDYVPF